MPLPSTLPDPYTKGAASADMSGGVVIVGITEHIIELEVVDSEDEDVTLDRESEELILEPDIDCAVLD